MEEIFTRMKFGGETFEDICGDEVSHCSKNIVLWEDSLRDFLQKNHISLTYRGNNDVILRDIRNNKLYCIQYFLRKQEFDYFGNLPYDEYWDFENIMEGDIVKNEINRLY